MAYETQYRITFTNNQNHEVIIDLMEKDSTAPVSVQEYAATSVTLTKNGPEGVLSPIIGTELVMTFDMRTTDIDYWNDFVDAEHDTWKVIATLDGKYCFHGFVIPDQGAVPFQDRPYQASIRATDCLGLLKTIPLTNFAGINFEDSHTVITYIGAILQKTNLELEIKVYDYIYHKSMLTRSDDLKWDFVSQTSLEARTFQQDPVTFYSCFDALQRICELGFRVGYDAGYFVFKRLGMFQYNPAPKYYTVYSSDVSTATGFEDPSDHTLVGVDDIIFAINEDQIKTVSFANRSVKTPFNYVVWPELPKNNKFERGALIPLLSGSGYTSYEVDDWTYGRFISQPSIITNLPAVPATPARAYRKSEYNAYGIELSREIILEGVPSPGGVTFFGGLLVSTAVPCIRGDEIRLRFEHKTNYSAVGIGSVAMLFIKPTIGGQPYFLTGIANRENSPLRWGQFTGNQVAVRYEFFTDRNEYQTISIIPPTIPIDGDLYVGMFNAATTGFNSYQKSWDFVYTPMVAGGYIPVLGDYWIRSQNKNYPDAFDDETFLSDNIHKVLKGCLLKPSTSAPYTPEWNRFGVTETRHYKELINIAVYNLLYRRFWNIEGTFKGLTANAENNPTTFFPLSLFQVYKFNDISPEERYFILTTPIEQDLITGHFRGQFTEVNMVPDGAVPITESLQAFILRVVQTINATTEAEWDSASGAPASGTIGFPPASLVDPNVPNTIRIVLDDANNMITTVATGGAGNSPSITQIYNQDIGTVRFIQATFGTDIAIGNVFTFSAYGHNVNVTVQGSTALSSADGSQLGDSSSFNYAFK